MRLKKDKSLKRKKLGNLTLVADKVNIVSPTGRALPASQGSGVSAPKRQYAFSYDVNQAAPTSVNAPGNIAPRQPTAPPQNLIQNSLGRIGTLLGNAAWSYVGQTLYNRAANDFTNWLYNDEVTPNEAASPTSPDQFFTPDTGVPPQSPTEYFTPTSGTSESTLVGSPRTPSSAGSRRPRPPPIDTDLSGSRTDINYTPGSSPSYATAPTSRSPVTPTGYVLSGATTPSPPAISPISPRPGVWQPPYQQFTAPGQPPSATPSSSSGSTNWPAPGVYANGAPIMMDTTTQAGRPTITTATQMSPRGVTTSTSPAERVMVDAGIDVSPTLAAAFGEEFAAPVRNEMRNLVYEQEKLMRETEEDVTRMLEIHQSLQDLYNQSQSELSTATSYNQAIAQYVSEFATIVLGNDSWTRAIDRTRSLPDQIGELLNGLVNVDPQLKNYFKRLFNLTDRLYEVSHSETQTMNTPRPGVWTPPEASSPVTQMLRRRRGQAPPRIDTSRGIRVQNLGAGETAIEHEGDQWIPERMQPKRSTAPKVNYPKEKVTKRKRR